MERILANSGWRGGGYSTAEAFCAEFDGVPSNELIDRMLYIDIKNHLQSLLHLKTERVATSLDAGYPA